MNSIKIFLGVFLAGILVGWITTQSFVSIRQSENETRAVALVDFIIDEWTTPGIDSADVPNRAQFPAAQELPMSRAGFFPDTVCSLAQIVEERYRVPSSVTLAQWALESRWGKNNLGVSNYFGHTFAATGKFTQRKQFVVRKELVSVLGINVSGSPVKFTSYSSIAESFDVHGKYLSSSSLYVDAFHQETPEKFVRVIARRYATDPDYATKLITIIRRYKLNS